MAGRDLQVWEAAALAVVVRVVVADAAAVVEEDVADAVDRTRVSVSIT